MSRAVTTIAPTIGDPNGIGPEIAVKAAAGAA
jgi:4-hydroxy-L-threonine phosphate dehydrogenase PdxA